MSQQAQREMKRKRALAQKAFKYDYVQNNERLIKILEDQRTREKEEERLYNEKMEKIMNQNENMNEKKDLGLDILHTLKDKYVR